MKGQLSFFKEEKRKPKQKLPPFFQSFWSPPAVTVPAPSEQHFISCSAVVHTIFGRNYPFTSLTLNIPNFVISELIDHLPAPRYVLIEHTFYFRRSHLYHLRKEIVHIWTTNIIVHMWTIVKTFLVHMWYNR